MAGRALLPQMVQEIAEVIGRERALYLVGHYLKWNRRGQYGKSSYLYVPRKLGTDHRLVAILGWDCARALVDAFGGEILQISSCKGVVQQFRDSEIRRLAASQAANDDTMAEMFNLTVRHVRSIKAA